MVHKLPAMNSLPPWHAASVAAAMSGKVTMRGCGRRLQLTQRIRKFGTEVVPQRIIIIGGGIAGLSTARYLLHHTEHDKSATITLIDKNYVESSPGASSSSPSSYEEQVLQPHLSIPSRRNGNVLCPSLTVPWTTRSLWKETFLPGLKSLISSSESSVPSITFEWSSLLMDRKMVCGLFLIFFNKYLLFVYQS